MPQVIDIQKTGAHLKELCRQHGIAVSDIQKLLYLNARSRFTAGSREKHCRQWIT